MRNNTLEMWHNTVETRHNTFEMRNNTLEMWHNTVEMRHFFIVKRHFSLNLILFPIFAAMKVSGFSFIRNALKYDYPIVEAISSILPICDEFVLALGNSDDETEALISSIGSDKIKIIKTVWDETLKE